jgi:hypothetical protein
VATRLAAAYIALYRLRTPKNVHAMRGLARTGGTCANLTGTGDPSGATAGTTSVSGLSELSQLSRMEGRRWPTVPSSSSLANECEEELRHDREIQE